MDDRARTRSSRFLSLILRHRPEAAGVTLDAHGWVAIDALLAGCAAAGHPLDRATLDVIVATSPKQRFAFSEDGLRIRASQGHSVEVELGYAPAPPPPLLFHGTHAAAIAAIRVQGLCKMSRHHVHLSSDETTAANVGGRRGAPIVLRVDAACMVSDGHVFYCSANGVWLTDVVPARYLSFPDT